MQMFSHSFRKSALVFFFGFMLTLAFSKWAEARERDKEMPNTAITTGIASYYHDKFQGRRTATGETFNQKLLTCASNQFSLGTWLRVTNMRNGKSVFVRVNDRMHPKMKRVVDLSKLAAQIIGIEKSGVGKVSIENLGNKKPDSAG